jgi:hypothetical protein
MVFVGQGDPVEVDRGREEMIFLSFCPLGAIAIKIPANQTVISGDDGGLGCLTKMERKRGKKKL